MDIPVEEPLEPRQPEALLVNLSKYSNMSGMLHVKIIEHAQDFMHLDILK